MNSYIHVHLLDFNSLQLLPLMKLRLSSSLVFGHLFNSIPESIWHEPISLCYCLSIWLHQDVSGSVGMCLTSDQESTSFTRTPCFSQCKKKKNFFFKIPIWILGMLIIDKVSIDFFSGQNYNRHTMPFEFKLIFWLNFRNIRLYIPLLFYINLYARPSILIFRFSRTQEMIEL